MRNDTDPQSGEPKSAKCSSQTCDFLVSQPGKGAPSKNSHPRKPVYVSGSAQYEPEFPPYIMFSAPQLRQDMSMDAQFAGGAGYGEAIPGAQDMP